MPVPATGSGTSIRPGLLGVDDESQGLERVLKVEGGGLVLVCAGCGARNDVRTSACGACGRSFAATALRVADQETTERAQAGDRAAAQSVRSIAAAAGAGPLAALVVIAAAAAGLARGLKGVMRRRP
jgi:ribosomal protein L40E